MARRVIPTVVNRLNVSMLGVVSALALPGFYTAATSRPALMLNRRVPHAIMVASADEVAKAKAVLSSPILANVDEKQRLLSFEEGVSEAAIDAALGKCDTDSNDDTLFAEVLADAKKEVATERVAPSTASTSHPT